MYLKLGLPKFPKAAGTMKEFRDWDLKLKKEFPFRYAMNNFFSDIYRRFILFPSWRLRDAWWGIKYRVVPKYKYTEYKLARLKPGYQDTDTLILYFAFEQFEVFMKRQLTNPRHVWEYTKEHFEDWMEDDEVEAEIAERNALWKEMNELYEWWTVTVPNQEETLPEYNELPEEWGTMAVFNEDFDNEPQMIEHKKISDQRIQIEEQWKKDETEYLIRLMKIRMMLWD